MLKHALLDILQKAGFSEKIVDAFAKVRREDFVPDHLKTYAYEDIALPIEDGSTLSQPSTIAFMLSLLDLHQGQKILEVGSGSGYTLALISDIIKNGKVYGIELNKTIAINSKIALARDSNIEIFNRNGFNGLKESAPFDRIVLSASANSLPEHLIEQLHEGGILLVPVNQSLFKVVKKKGKNEITEFPGFAFVPLKEES